MSACFFILYRSVHHTDLHSFPTRRSSDLWFQSPAFLRLVHDTLGSRSFRESPYWTSGWWQKALERVEQGQLRLGWTIWHPFILEQWRRALLGPLQAQHGQARRAAA